MGMWMATHGEVAVKSARTSGRGGLRAVGILIAIPHSHQLSNTQYASNLNLHFLLLDTSTLLTTTQTITIFLLHHRLFLRFLRTRLLRGRLKLINTPLADAPLAAFGLRS